MTTVFDETAEGTRQETVRMTVWQPADGGISMELPEGFSPMEESRREAYFPLEDRPERILEYAGEEVQITFQITGQTMKKEETAAAAQQIRETAEEAARYGCSPVYLERLGEIRTAWFLIQMKDIEKEHIKAVLSVKDRMALLTLTYPEDAGFKWRALWEMILGSMKEEKDHGADGKWRF